MAEPVSIDQQVRELKKAGWKQHATSAITWIAPWGGWFIGPHGAWKVLRGIDAEGKEAPRG